jgi:hypothetical protein
MLAAGFICVGTIGCFDYSVPLVCKYVAGLAIEHPAEPIEGVP